MNETGSASRNVAQRGILCVVSGPSGSGKTTLCRSVSETDPRCVYSISCTTRPPREGEVDGKDYLFLSEDDFKQRVNAGDFLEFAEVHGRYYGTLREWVERHLDDGADVVMDIDVQGAAQVRGDGVGGSFVDVFLLPPNMEELKSRLAGRATESEAQMQLRLENALQEIAQWQKYRYTIVSGSREDDAAALRAILKAEKCRTDRAPAGTAEDFGAVEGSGRAV